MKQIKAMAYLLLLLVLLVPSRAQPPLRQDGSEKKPWDWQILGGEKCDAGIWALWSLTELPDTVKVLFGMEALKDSVLRGDIRKNWNFYRKLKPVDDKSRKVLDRQVKYHVFADWDSSTVFSEAGYDGNCEEIIVDRRSGLILKDITYGKGLLTPKSKPLGRIAWKNHSQANARILYVEVDFTYTYEDSIVHETGRYYLYWFWICRNIGWLGELQREVIPVAEEKPSLGMVSGSVFHDQNRDGFWNVETEPGLSNWPVKMFIGDKPANKDAPADRTTYTDSAGYYYFDSLAAGNYHVSEIPEKNWEQTTEEMLTAGLAEGDTIEHLDFGNYQPPTQKLIGIRCLHFDAELHLGFGSVGYYLWDTASLRANWYWCKYSPKLGFPSVKIGTGRQASFEPQAGWKNDFSWAGTSTLSKGELGIRLADRHERIVEYFYGGVTLYQGVWQNYNFEWENIISEASLPLVGNIGIETVVSYYPALNYNWMRGRLWYELSRNFLGGRWQAGIEGYDEGDARVFSSNRDYYYQRLGFMVRYNNEWSGAKWDYFLLEWGHGYYGYFIGAEFGIQLVRFTKIHSGTLQQAYDRLN